MPNTNRENQDFFYCHCAIAVCNISKYAASSSRTNDGLKISFHRFPKDPATRQKWILACKREVPVDPDKGSVCSDHFDEEDFERDLKSELLGTPAKRKLKPGSVPHLNISRLFKNKRKPSAREVRSIEKKKKEEHRRIIDELLNKPNEETTSVISSVDSSSFKSDPQLPDDELLVSNIIIMNPNKCSKASRSSNPSTQLVQTCSSKDDMDIDDMLLEAYLTPSQRMIHDIPIPSTDTTETPKSAPLRQDYSGARFNLYYNVHPKDRRLKVESKPKKFHAVTTPECCEDSFICQPVLSTFSFKEEMPSIKLGEPDYKSLYLLQSKENEKLRCDIVQLKDKLALFQTRLSRLQNEKKQVVPT